MTRGTIVLVALLLLHNLFLNAMDKNPETLEPSKLTEKSEINNVESSEAKELKAAMFLELWKKYIEKRNFEIRKRPARSEENEIAKQFAQEALQETESFLKQKIDTEKDESAKKIYEAQLKGWNANKEDLQCIEEMYSIGFQNFLCKMKAIFLDQIENLWFKKSLIHSWKDKNLSQKRHAIAQDLFLLYFCKEHDEL